MQERRSYLADVIRALIGMPVCREMPGPRKGAVLEQPTVKPTVTRSP